MKGPELWCFFSSLVFCIVVAAGIIAVIHKRFQVMMVDLCEGEARARFWTLAVEAWFLLSGITASLTWRPEGEEDRQLFMGSVNLIKSGLNGMSNAIVLFSVGLVVFIVIRKFKGKEIEEMRRETV